MMHPEDLNSLLIFHRKRAGLTQVALAECAGVSRTVVQDLEAGKGRASWKHLVMILNVLNITLEPTGPLVADWKKSQRAIE
jgi:DNA-binding XRE family transcriptional regulator